jgi:hypothetical protein
MKKFTLRRNNEKELSNTYIFVFADYFTIEDKIIVLYKSDSTRPIAAFSALTFNIIGPS